ncbi:hypothetical protein [Allonocardiopsis opalescens]|uniref:Uncharacterized protein n=1 Tax=Allonocardiopsis opalescens TaxID=1144618 RepID=A0A2T0QDH6_9ACTN|nr:hypothetical protein [Allonocardiopsis opalescens]PRY01958.1 hypothetical protein CLV72_101556 [Allonocardiopsis opalescens]
MQETIASALAQLGRLDPRAARQAEAALTTLTGGDGLESLSQRTVQEFCWYVLPVKFLSDLEEQLFTAHSLARLFRMLDLPRYAEICDGETTREVLERYLDHHDEGVRAYEKAMRLSGVQPPDLQELSWGTMLGAVETDAFEATAAALELTIASGDLRPGARGWRSTQAELTRMFLTQPDMTGRSRLDKVREERVRSWLSSGANAHRQQLTSMAGQLIQGTEPPYNVGEILAPIRRILDFAADGIPLTQVGNITPTIVRRLCSEFGWHALPDPPRTEGDVAQLMTLHGLLRSMRAVRRTGRKLLITRAGRQMREFPTALWRSVTESVIPTGGFEQAAVETGLALLLTRPRAMTSDDLAQAAGEILAEAGWQDRRTGSGPDRRQVSAVLVDLNWLLETLKLVTGSRLVTLDQPRQLTTAGRAFVLATLHTAATAPRTSL